MTLIDGITSRSVQTPRLRANVLERAGDPAHGGPDVVFIHGNVSSALFWQDAMLSMPEHWRVFAVDLRGFGDSETLPVDPTRGLRDFSDDVAGVIAELGLGRVHVVGWSMGAGVAMQYALDHPVRSLTLQSPVSPYGFGGTAADGSRLTDDDAGCGGGGVNPDFVARLESGDTSSESDASPRSVYASSYVLPGFVSDHEDIWVESMLTTTVGIDNYPGDGVASDNWPGFAAGSRGVLNTMAPKYLNLSAIVDLEPKPPLTWIHGANDVIVSDTSFFDINYLGEIGVIPGWPGSEVAPRQPMVTQTRTVFESYAAAGGTFQELVLENCGHSPHLEYPEAFRDALVATVEAAGGE
ncbi:alpha/beta hydrolase [Diaminobutyricibacter tongyongensis]|uniref:Alpha/beta hydrolase n=1 Tax=Leifsonia tongyongensis TaxID=1268043 RepID=A0A6L9XT99_9MICO|nr:alpha/beta hydrolase [Diaminobutyricibacter tongyongensis]NEN04630.1 alpha/beta hydrolase [Diaminobutyricibacter tongyongensis]